MRIGIDLGGTKIEGVLLDEAGQISQRIRKATPQQDYPATLAVIVELVGELEAGLSPVPHIGLGTPGSRSPATGRMRNCNSTCLNDQPLLDDLQRLLVRPVVLANDADCFTLSEATDGAAQGANSVFGVILGTGTGGGLVIHQSLIAGPNGIAGEWGHNPFPVDRCKVPAGPRRPCYCGREDCIETYLSGPGLALSYQQLTGLNLTADAVAAKAEAGDTEAVMVLAEYCEQLAGWRRVEYCLSVRRSS